MLPRHQIGKGQRGPAELLIKPDTEIMQRHLSGQADLKAFQGVRALAVEAKDMLQAVVDGLHDLANTGQPASPGLGPGMAAVALRGTDQFSPVDVLPVAMAVFALKALVGDIHSLSRCPDAGDARVRESAQSEERLSQGLILVLPRRSQSR